MEQGLSETPSDEELVSRCRLGDQGSWTLLVTRHTRRVFAIGYRMLGKADAAEDLTQDVFLRVHQSLDRFHLDRGGRFDAWVTSVARNLAIDTWRRQRTERLRREEDVVLERQPARGESQQARLERRERTDLVRAGLKALPSDLRDVVVLCDLRGLSYDEAATAIGIPLGTVKSRLNRARIELARRLARRVAARPHFCAEA